MTGIYFHEQTSDALIDAVNHFEELGERAFDYKRIRTWAEEFSEERFKQEILEFVKEKYEEFKKNGINID